MWLFFEFVKNVINAWYICSMTVAFMADGGLYRHRKESHVIKIISLFAMVL